MELPEDGSKRQLDTSNYSRVKLIFAAFAAQSLFTAIGTFMAWPSPGIIKMADLNYTQSKIDLFVSIANLAPGPLLTIFCIDTIGRKNTLLIIWITLMACWIMFLISSDINVMLVARFIGGWGMGGAFSAVGIYVSEISDTAVRGALNSLNMVFLAIGSIIGYSVGPYVSMDTLTLVCLVATLGYGPLYYFIPESPYYLVGKGRFDSAKANLKWLRYNSSEDKIEVELSQIKFTIEEERRHKTGIKKLITSKAVLKQFCVAFFLMYIQQAGGMAILSTYGQVIFEDAKLQISAELLPILLAIVMLFSSLLSSFIVRRFGNRHLFIITGYTVTLSHAGLALYFILQQYGYDVSVITFIPIFCSFLLMVSMVCGLGGVVWAVASEIFAPSIKGAATGICGIFSTFLGFVQVYVFSQSKNNFGYGYTFLGFAVVYLISSIGFYFIPDTTHMTFQEIQDYFENNKSTTTKKKDISTIS